MNFLPPHYLVTCLDPRCVPENFFGPNMAGGVFRNAGGRATDDAIRSITALRALVGMQTIVVVHHTGRYLHYLDSPSYRVYGQLQPKTDS